MAYCALKASSGKGGAGAPKAPPLDTPLGLSEKEPESLPVLEVDFKKLISKVAELYEE